MLLFPTGSKRKISGYYPSIDPTEAIFGISSRSLDKALDSTTTTTPTTSSTGISSRYFRDPNAPDRLKSRVTGPRRFGLGSSSKLSFSRRRQGLSRNKGGHLSNSQRSDVERRIMELKKQALKRDENNLRHGDGEFIPESAQQQQQQLFTSADHPLHNTVANVSTHPPQLSTFSGEERQFSNFQPANVVTFTVTSTVYRTQFVPRVTTMTTTVNGGALNASPPPAITVTTVSTFFITTTPQPVAPSVVTMFSTLSVGSWINGRLCYG